MNRINESKKRLFGAVGVKKVIMMMVVLYKGLFLADIACANNVRISGEPEVQLNATSDSLQLKFTLSWDNSWRDDFNWDAVWLFVKYKKEGSNDAWNHLYLSPDQTGTVNLEMDPGNTGDKIVGAFVYPKNSGAFNISGEQVVLKAPLNGLSASDITNQKIYFAVQAIEMVLIPYGPYYLGDGKSYRGFHEPYTAERNAIRRLGYRALASSSVYGGNNFDSNWGLPNAIDANIGTLFHSAGTTEEWFMVDFGRAYKMEYFTICTHYPGSGYYVEGTNDTTADWTELWRGSGSDWSQTQTKYKITHPALYQYYRFRETANYLVIYDVSLYEEEYQPIYVDSEAELSVAQSQGSLSDNRLLPAAYPKGYKGFYMMKYELSQEQYVNFLNMLSYSQQKKRIGNNLDHLHRGDYVFGDPAHPSCRNGIAVFSHKGSAQPVVFGNNLNPADPFFAGDDGQTLACNYLTGPDMLAYLDWSGLRPLSELEDEKACRTPDRSLAGEYAWNTTGLTRLSGQSGLAVSTIGTENEIPSDLSVNANAGNAGFGPVRCGSFGSSTSNQQQSGASFYGVMELSGNLGEMCYSVIGGSGLNVSSSNNEYHGDGVIASDGNHNVSGYWNGSSTTNMLSIRGGSFASADSLLRVSDRSVLMDYDNSLRDSTVTFRGVRSIGESVDPGSISLSGVLCPGITATVEETAATHVRGDLPFRYVWSYSTDNGSSWVVIPGATGNTLSYDAFETGQSYIFKRTAICALGEASTQTTGVMAMATTAITSLSRDETIICEVLFSVSATGDALTYQWQQDGVDIPGATEAIYAADNNGEYRCRLIGTCGTVVSGTQIIDEHILVDPRDGQTYRTRMLADGREWMIENLRFGNCSDSTFDSYYQESVQNQIASGYWGVCIESPQSGGGHLYNWQAAMNHPDAVHNTSGNPSGNVDANSNVQWRGICPEGWHLPTGGTDGEFQQLYMALESTVSRIYPGCSYFQGVLSGFGTGNTVTNPGNYAYYWSSTYSNDTYAYILDFYSGGVNPKDYSFKYYGFAVRCVKDY